MFYLFCLLILLVVRIQCEEHHRIINGLQDFEERDNDYYVSDVEKIVAHRSDIDAYVNDYFESPTLVMDNIDTFNFTDYRFFANISVDIIKNVYKSTVGIYAYYESGFGDPAAFGGTGTYISPTDIVTARHVVRSCTCRTQIKNVETWIDCQVGCLPHYYLKRVTINPRDPYVAHYDPHQNSQTVKVYKESSTKKDYNWNTIDDLAILKSSVPYQFYVKLGNKNCALNHSILCVHYPSGWDSNADYDLLDGKIKGSEIYGFFGKGRKVLAVGNVTTNPLISMPTETLIHNTFTWFRSSGASLVNVQTGEICAIHVGGKYWGNVAHGMEHPFLQDIYAKLSLKQEL